MRTLTEENTMRTRTWIIASSLTALVGLAAWWWWPRDPIDPATLPLKYKDHNVILVSFDALQAAHVGSLGNPRKVTPTLDKLASQAFSFERC